MVRGPRPPANATQRAVLGSLGVHGNLSPSMLTYIQFEPTLGIAAGRINKLGMDIRSFKEPLTRAIREVMVPSIRANFDSGGRPAWEPLSEATLEIRKRWGIGGSSPLILSGTLRRVASQINIWTIGQQSATIRDLPDSIWYGKIHQAGYGGSGGSKRVQGGAGLQDIIDRQKEALRNGGTMGGSRGASPIPARPFLVIQPEDEDAIAEIFIKWLDERVARTMWGKSTGRLG